LAAARDAARDAAAYSEAYAAERARAERLYANQGLGGVGMPASASPLAYQQQHLQQGAAGAAWGQLGLGGEALPGSYQAPAPFTPASRPANSTLASPLHLGAGVGPPSTLEGGVRGGAGVEEDPDAAIGAGKLESIFTKALTKAMSPLLTPASGTKKRKGPETQLDLESPRGSWSLMGPSWNSVGVGETSTKCT